MERRSWTLLTRTPASAHALALLITLYAGLLRLDAFTGKYGTLDHPAWARIATQTIAPIVAYLRPSSVVWYHEQRPYVGGDPINYLAYGREMKSFYQAHVREPVFLAMTRAGLWALDGQDAAVSLASAIGSTLTVFATYLLGAAVLSPAAGLVAALLMAVEYEAIIWAPDGWRDDTFTAAAVFAAWTLVRLLRNPSYSNAAIAGAVGGIACLTRITAISLILPGLLWLVMDGGTPPRRDRLRHAALALVVLAAVVAPYLINCAIATGDPLLAINYHTSYYRFAEGRPATEPMSVSEYLRTKFSARPVATLDTALNGLFVQPFVTKWHGLVQWMRGLGAVTKWLALAGLAAMPFFRAGRLFLVLLLTSLLPYVFTWNLGGGGEWRFTMHAYPFFLIAAACAIVGIARIARTVVKDPGYVRSPATLLVARRAAGMLAVAALGTLTFLVLPWFVVREAIAHGESTSIETGPRDAVFYTRGWSAPHTEGITARISRGERSIVRIPLPAKREYDLVLRIDPLLPEVQDRVSVLFNKQLVGALRLSWNPERVGSYTVRVREQMVNTGSNELTIIPASLVTAGAAGSRYAWLDPDDQVGVRLWYVRVLPLP